jgi:hypothetical protein
VITVICNESVMGEKLETVGEKGTIAMREKALDKRWWFRGRSGWASDPCMVAGFMSGKA